MNHPELPYPVVDQQRLPCTAFSDNFFESGAILLIDKPEGWTSFDVVNKIRKITKVKKAGHCGTLDPLATGLLIVLTGKATKSVSALMTEDKIYDTVFTFGIETDTYDRQGRCLQQKAIPEISADDWKKILTQWTGEISQMPPPFSAIKQKGIPLYKLARKGLSVEVKPRKVWIHSIRMTDWRPPSLFLSIHCGKGTYIRSLAHDIGRHIGCGAIVSALRRTAIGPYDIENALSLADLQSSLLVERNKPYVIH